MIFRKHLSARAASSNPEVTEMHIPPMVLDFASEAVAFALSHAAF